MTRKEFKTIRDSVSTEIHRRFKSIPLAAFKTVRLKGRKCFSHNMTTKNFFTLHGLDMLSDTELDIRDNTDNGNYITRYDMVRKILAYPTLTSNDSRELEEGALYLLLYSMCKQERIFLITTILDNTVKGADWSKLKNDLMVWYTKQDRPSRLKLRNDQYHSRFKKFPVELVKLITSTAADSWHDYAFDAILNIVDELAPDHGVNWNLSDICTLGLDLFIARKAANEYGKEDNKSFIGWLNID